MSARVNNNEDTNVQDVIISASNVPLSEQGKTIIENIINSIADENESNVIWVVHAEKTKDNKTKLSFGVCDEIDLKCTGFKSKMEIPLPMTSKKCMHNDQLQPPNHRLQYGQLQSMHAHDINFNSVDNNNYNGCIGNTQPVQQVQQVQQGQQVPHIQSQEIKSQENKGQETESTCDINMFDNSMVMYRLDFLHMYKHDLQLCKNIMRSLAFLIVLYREQNTYAYDQIPNQYDCEQAIIHGNTVLKEMSDVLKLSWNAILESSKEIEVVLEDSHYTFLKYQNRDRYIYEDDDDNVQIWWDCIQLLCQLTTESDECRATLVYNGIITILESMLHDLNMYLKYSPSMDRTKTRNAIRKLLIKLVRHLCIRSADRGFYLYPEQAVNESIVDFTGQFFLASLNENKTARFVESICQPITEREVKNQGIRLQSMIILKCLIYAITMSIKEKNNIVINYSDHDRSIAMNKNAKVNYNLEEAETQFAIDKMIRITESAVPAIDKIFEDCKHIDFAVTNRSQLVMQALTVLNMLAKYPQNCVIMMGEYRLCSGNICTLVKNIHLEFNEMHSGGIGHWYQFEAWYDDGFGIISKCLQLLQTTIKSVSRWKYIDKLIFTKYQNVMEYFWNNMMKESLMYYFIKYNDHFEEDKDLVQYMTHYASIIIFDTCDTLCQLVVDLPQVVNIGIGSHVISTMEKIVDLHVEKHNSLINDTFSISLQNININQAHEHLTFNEFLMYRLFKIFFVFKNYEWNNIIRYIWIGFYKNNNKYNKKCYICLLPKDIVKHLIKYIANGQIDKQIYTWKNTKWSWLLTQ